MDTHAAPDVQPSPSSLRADAPEDAASAAPSADPGPTDDPPAALPAPSRRRRRLARRALGGIVVVALAAGIFTAGVGLDRTGRLGGPASETVSADAGDFALVREAWNLLHEKYVGAKNLDGRDLAYGAIEGLTGAVDDPGHTSFMTPEERERSHQSLAGSFVGIGIEVEDGDTGAKVVTVMRGSPAAKAGLRPADRIVAVDGTAVGKAGLEKVVSMIRGSEGTSVTVTLERDGASDPIVVTMVRAKIDLPTVTWAKVPGTTIAMLRIESFSSTSADQVKTALKEILASDATGIVLDLRGNPGGYINEAISIASQFLTTGDVHLSRDASGTITPTVVQPDGLAPSIPLVVLVDEGSASSSEIVAGALQDAGRAKLVGRKTYGTGTVLSEVGLSDGSALRIGVIEWLTPNGRSIWREGLTPDDPVSLATDVTPLAPDDLRDMSPKALKASGDAQLLKALELLQAAPTTTPRL